MHILFFNPQGNFDPADSYLTEHPDFGGQLVYVKEVAMARADAGHRVDIVTRQIVDPDWPEFQEPVAHYDGYGDELRIVRLPCGGPRFLAKEALWPHLPEFVSNARAFYGAALPDFMTAHYADGGYCASLMQAGTGIGFTFTGHSLGAQKLDKLGMNRSNADEMEERFRFSIRIGAERMSMQRAYRIITSTRQERMEQYSHALYRGAVDVEDDTRFSVIPPGVNTRVFTVEPGAEDGRLAARLDAADGNGKRPSLVISSRIDEKKNIGKAVEAWAGSPALHQRADLVLCIRGIDDPWTEISSMSEEEQAVLSPILETIARAGLRDSVRFLNLQSQAELAACYRYFAQRGSLFVLPSVYEPFGLAPIEAAACGLACVATANGGPSEIFADGSGILVDPFDADDIARGLREALDRAPELARLGRQRVLDKYTWQETATRYLDVISEGVAGGPAPLIDAGPPDAASRLQEYLGRE